MGQLMALFVYITEECRSDAEAHALLSQVEKLAVRLSDEQRTTLLDPFPPGYLKKRFTRQTRLLAAERYVGDHIVVCFYRFLVRSSSDYKAFVDDPKEWGDQYLVKLVSDEQLETWLEERLLSNPPPQKPIPTEKEKMYLWDVLAKAEAISEPLVCESGDWVESVSDDRYKEKLILFVPPLLGICESKPDEKYEYSIPDRSDMTIMARYFPSIQVVFLIAPLSRNDNETRIHLRDRYKEILEENDAALSKEYILQHSTRAYPLELLLDEDMWLDAQKDEAANLALSPEEAQILESEPLLVKVQD